MIPGDRVTVGAKGAGELIELRQQPEPHGPLAHVRFDHAPDPREKDLWVSAAECKPEPAPAKPEPAKPVK